MIIRALQPHEESLYQEAYSWTLNSPQWFRDMDEVYPLTFTEYHMLAYDPKQIDYGIFDDDLIGVFTICEASPSRFNVHVAAKRGTSLEVLSYAARVIKDELFESGVVEIFGWAAKRNRGLLRLAHLCGLRPDGLVMFKGQMRGRVIEWLRLGARNEKRSKDDNDANTATGEHLWVYDARRHAGHPEFA